MIGYVKTLVTNKPEVQLSPKKIENNVWNKGKEYKSTSFYADLNNMALHELLDTIETTQFGGHDFRKGIDYFVTIN